MFYIIEGRPSSPATSWSTRSPFRPERPPGGEFPVQPVRRAHFGDYTAENIGNPFAIVLDGEVISAPTIQSHIPGGSGIITGRFTVEEARSWRCCCARARCRPS